MRDAQRDVRCQRAMLGDPLLEVGAGVVVHHHARSARAFVRIDPAVADHAVDLQHLTHPRLGLRFGMVPRS